MSPSFCTRARATRLAPPKTFSYSRYTFMYSCLSGTILLKPASTARREAEATKSAVRIAKTTSQTLRWSKRIRETPWISLSRVTSVLRRRGHGDRPRARFAQQEQRVGRSQHRTGERARGPGGNRLER